MTTVDDRYRTIGIARWITDLLEHDYERERPEEGTPTLASLAIVPRRRSGAARRKERWPLGSRSRRVRRPDSLVGSMASTRCRHRSRRPVWWSFDNNKYSVEGTA
jgi:hypothetical protein